MKSGPTLNGATVWPALRKAPIKPVATVVFPLPDAGAAMITAGTGVMAPPGVARVRIMTAHTACRRTDTHARDGWPRGRSPLDAPLPLAPRVHRMLDLGHLGDQIGRLDQPLRGIASGDHHMLVAGSGQQPVDHVAGVDPPPLQRIGEFVQHVEVVALRGQPARDLGPTVDGRRRVIDFAARPARPGPARAHLVPFDGSADTVPVVQLAESGEGRLLAHLPLRALDELEHGHTEPGV